MDLTLLRKLPVFLTAALYSGLTTWTGLAHADGIVADGGTATTVDQVGQTDVVNIATPSAQGVSYNTFDRYDIDQHGAVLNNSRVDGTSTLAGELQANPNLSGGSANIILNEVTSNRRSDLEGLTELFGDNARYILANPNGITCDGCGFIRTPTAAGDTGNRLEQVLLSTATPSLDTLGSTPVHLQVDEDNNARLIIGQGGLDAGNVDITTLLTRRAEINGLIDALDGELQLYAGAGSLGVNQDGSASWQAMDGADNRPTVAIDAAAAGAMHAGQIFIQSTDEGTGVTLPPDLISTRDIRISAAGDIVYTDAEARGGQVQVTAGGAGATLTAQGRTRAGDDVVLDAADDIDTGSILAGNNILVTSRNGQVAVRDATADGDVTVTAEDDVQYRHITASSGNVTVTTASDAARIRTTGRTRAGNTLIWNISGPEAVVAAGTGGLEAGATVRFNCVSGEGTCALRSLRDLNLSATTLETQADITTTAGNDLRIGANLDSARDITSGGRLTITARDSDIRSRGRLAAAGDITLTAAASSEIRLEGDLHGGGGLYLRGAGTYRHTDSGDFQVAGDWHIDLFGLTNEGILSDLHGGTLRVSRLDNRGLIENQAALILQVDDTLDNSGILASLEGAVDIGHSQAGQSTRQITNRGIITAIDLTSNQTGDTGMILDPAALIQDHTRAILAGEQRSAADLTRRINTANAELIAELNLNAEVTGVLNIDATSLTNQGGGRISGSDLNLDIDTLNNHGGQLLAGRNLTLNGDELNNTYAGGRFGVMSAANQLTLNLERALLNSGIIDGKNVSIFAPQQTNTGSGHSLASLRGASLSTQSDIATLTAQPWFDTADVNSRYQYEFRRLYGNQLLQSDLTRLTEAFLQANDVQLDAEHRLIGDDVYLAQLLMQTLRSRGGVPFVTGDRDGLRQLATLYSNTHDYLRRTGLRFGQMPSRLQREALNAPVLIFTARSEPDGRQVYIPQLLMPDDHGRINPRAEQLNTQILAHQNLFLQGERISVDDADLIAGDNLVIEATDLDIKGTQRNWYVDASGQVQYRTATVEAGNNLLVTLKGNYVQNGAQVLAGNQIAVQAKRIDITEQRSRAQQQVTSKRRLAGYNPWRGLMSLSRRRAGDRFTLRRWGYRRTSNMSAARARQFSSMRGNKSYYAGSDNRPNMQAQSVLLVAKDDLTLTRADIRASGQRNKQHHYERGGGHYDNDHGNAGGLTLIADNGSITNSGSYLQGERITMQAGKDITNRSRLTVHNNRAVRYRSRTSYYDDNDTRRHRFQETDIRSQRVETDVARIDAGEGGLIQVAGEDIQNLGTQITSAGDIIQKADGDITNRSLAQRYLQQQVRDHRSIARGYDRRNNTIYSVATQQTRLQAEGDILQQSGQRVRNIGARLQADGDILQQARTGIENTTLLATGKRVEKRDRYQRRINDDDYGYSWRRKQREHQFTNKTDIIRYDQVNTLQAGGDIIARVEEGDYHNSGNLKAGGDVLIAARDIRNTRLAPGRRNNKTVLDTGRIRSGGDTILSAERHITDTAGRYNAGGNILLQAEGNITQNAIRVRRDHSRKIDRGWFWYGTRKTTDIRHTAGSFNADGGVSLNAGGRLTLAGSDIRADNIELRGKDIQLNALRQYRQTVTRDGAYKINRRIRHDVVNLNSRGSIRVQADNDLTTYGSVLQAGAGGEGDLILNAGDDMRLLGVNDEDYSYYYRHESKSFGRSKTWIRERRNVRLAETRLRSGGNLLINVDSDGVRDSGKVVLEGTRIDVDQDIMMYAGDSLNMLSGIEYSTRRNEYHKSGFGGFSKSGSVHRRQARRLGHAVVNSGGDTILLSGGDINVVAGEITAENIVADAGYQTEDDDKQASINIIGEREALARFDHEYDRSFSFDIEDGFLSFAEEVHQRDWKVDENYIGSKLNARGSIELQANTDINIVGSELTAANLLNLSAGRDINLLAGTGSSLDRSQTTRERVGIEVTTDSNGINAFAGREVHTVNDELDNQTLQASILQAGNRVQLAAGNNVKQVSSDVAAGNDVIYQAGNDIMLDAALAYETSTHSETTRRDGISVSLSHNYESTRQAVKNAGEGDNDVSRTSSTLQAIDSVNNFLSGPTASGFAGTSITYQRAMESTGVARSSTLQAGGDIQLVASNDIDIRGSQLFAGNDMQLAAENVRILSVDNRFKQAGESRFERAGVIVNAGKNSASIGVGANFNEQLSDYDAAGAQISYLHAGNNLAINANTDILVGSSDLDATNDISLTAGRDVMLIAQAFDSNYDEQGKSWGAQVGIAATASTTGSPAVGIYGSVQLGDNELKRDGTSYRNSHLTAGNNLAIKSQRDTRVTGATAEAGKLSMDVGRNLTVVSVQDIEQADGRRRDVSGRVVAGAGGSVSLSVGYGETEGDKDWVAEQTRLVGRDSVDIRVEQHTQLDGALIANIDENGVDQGNLRLDTGTLAYNDIKDRHQETSYYLNVGITTSDEKGNNPNQQEGNRQTGIATLSGQKANGDGGTGFTISGYHSETDRSQINRATIGNGTVVVRDNSSQSVSGLNRDVALAHQLLKDEESNTNLYVSDSSIESVAGMFRSDDPATKRNENTFGRWKGEVKEYGRNTTRVYQALGKLGEIESNNSFISGMSKLAKAYNTAVDYMGYATLGLAPGVDNHGGAMAQVPVLATGDMFYYRVRAPLIVDEKTGKLILDPERVEILGEIERPEDGDHVFTNGIQNSMDEATRNSAMQTGAMEFVLAYNPEHGLLGDGLETTWDMYAGGLISSGNARQLRGFFQKGVDRNHSFNFAGHSQGGLITYRAMDGLDFTNGGQITETGTVLLSGAPVNYKKFFKVASDAGFVVGNKDTDPGEHRVVFQVNRPENQTTLFGTKVVDSVADMPLLGNNYDRNTPGALLDSILSLPELGGDNSPHSDYLCQGVTCAKARQPVLEPFRQTHTKPTLILQDGSKIRGQ